jgi:putative ABC transport system substrate-binding protein
MKRSLFLILVLLAAQEINAQAQQPAKVYRIGLLSAGSRSAGFTGPGQLRPLLEGLRELGYVEGQNIVIEYRFAQGKEERLADLATELLRKKVDVIIATSTPAAQAAKKSTVTIPIVMTFVGDPVVSGLVASLAQPGGNITGLSLLAPELNGKRLELLKEACPRASLIAVLWNPASSASELWLKEIEVAARALGVRLQPLEVRDTKDFDDAFSAITTKRAGALLVLRHPVFSIHQTRIVDFAAKSRLPAMYSRSGSAEAGGLMFYGPNDDEMWRRAATYVDKILKGAKPADLPVEQPMKFEFIINLKTAKQIGLTIPPNMLARADKVIK